MQKVLTRFFGLLSPVACTTIVVIFCFVGTDFCFGALIEIEPRIESEDESCRGAVATLAYVLVAVATGYLTFLFG